MKSIDDIRADDRRRLRDAGLRVSEAMGAFVTLAGEIGDPDLVPVCEAMLQTQAVTAAYLRRKLGLAE